MEYSAIPNHEEQEEVPITMRDDTPSSLSSSKAAMPSEYDQGLIVYAVRTVLVCAFGGLRIPYENNIVFATIAFVAATIVALFCAILWKMERYLHLPSSEILFAMLITIDCFTTFLAPFSLLMVLALPPELNWVGYLVACLMLGIVLTCSYLEWYYPDDQQEYKTYVPFVVLCLVVLSNGIPMDYVNSIWYPTLYLAFGLDTAYHFITGLIFINNKLARKSIVLKMLHST